MQSPAWPLASADFPPLMKEGQEQPDWQKKPDVWIVGVLGALLRAPDRSGHARTRTYRELQRSLGTHRLEHVPQRISNRMSE